MDSLVQKNKGRGTELRLNLSNRSLLGRESAYEPTDKYGLTCDRKLYNVQFIRGVAQPGLERLLWEQEVARSNRVTPIKCLL